MSAAAHPYARPAYVSALAAAGEAVVPIAEWGTGVLSRPIAEGGVDAAGPYPMTVLAEDADVAGGLESLRRLGMVSAVLVADPLAGARMGMEQAFDVARPFKTHHLVHPGRYAPSKHHRAEIRRSQARCTVERVDLADVLPAWTQLYGGLVERHAIAGPAAFSPGYFRHLATIPELVTLTARAEGRIVAMGLWFAHDGVAYNHLGASSPAGYAVGASYALYDAAIAHFAACRTINLGGGAGGRDDPADGLARFKRGFADGAAQAYLYGKVLDPVRYVRLSKVAETAWFPAYRDPSAGVQNRRTVAAILSMSAAS